jgi:hypothetical protein
MSTVQPAQARRPVATVAAWLCPVIPVVVALWFVWGARNGPYQHGDHGPPLAAALACVVGLLVGVVGLFGVRGPGAVLRLLAVIVGLLLNLGVGLLALLFYGLSWLPGP